jgi:hypothetical protein
MLQLLHLHKVQHQGMSQEAVQSMLDWFVQVCDESKGGIGAERLLAVLATTKFKTLIQKMQQTDEKQTEADVETLHVCDCADAVNGVCDVVVFDGKCTLPEALVNQSTAAATAAAAVCVQTVPNCRNCATVCHKCGESRYSVLATKNPRKSMAVFSLTHSLRQQMKEQTLAKALTVSSTRKYHDRAHQYIYNMYQGTETARIDAEMVQHTLKQNDKFPHRKQMTSHHLQIVLSSDGINLNHKDLSSAASVNPITAMFINLPDSMVSNHRLIHLMLLPPVNSKGSTLIRYMGKKTLSKKPQTSYTH